MRVIANSLPKSGTHLLVRLLELLELRERNPGLSGALIRPTQRNPLKRCLVRSGRCEIGDNACYDIDLDNRQYGIKRRTLDRHLSRLQAGEFFSAHLPYSEMLENHLLSQDITLLYIVRDPRDVLLSYYDHQVRYKDYPFHRFFSELTLDKALPHILDGIESGPNILASFKERLERSIGWCYSKNTVALRFEELIGSSGGGDDSSQKKQISDIISHMNMNLSNEQIDAVANKVFYRKAETFNKGVCGRWRGVFDEKSLELIESKIGSLIRELGYE